MINLQHAAMLSLNVFAVDTTDRHERASPDTIMSRLNPVNVLKDYSPKVYEVILCDSSVTFL